MIFQWVDVVLADLLKDIVFVQAGEHLLADGKTVAIIMARIPSTARVKLTKHLEALQRGMDGH